MRAFAGDISVAEGTAILLHVSVHREAHIPLKACCVHRGRKVFLAPESWNQVSILPVELGDKIEATNLSVRIRGFTLADTVEVAEIKYHEPSEGCEKARPLVGKMRRRSWNQPLHLHVRFHDLPQVADPLLRFIPSSDWANIQTMIQLDQRYKDLPPHEVAADLSDMMAVNGRMQGEIGAWRRRSLAMPLDAQLMRMAQAEFAGTHRVEQHESGHGPAARRWNRWSRGDAARRVISAAVQSRDQGLLQMVRVSWKTVDGCDGYLVEDFQGDETEWYMQGSAVCFKKLDGHAR